MALPFILSELRQVFRNLLRMIWSKEHTCISELVYSRASGGPGGCRAGLRGRGSEGQRPGPTLNASQEQIRQRSGDCLSMTCARRQRLRGPVSQLPTLQVPMAHIGKDSLEFQFPSPWKAAASRAGLRVFSCSGFCKSLLAPAHWSSIPVLR